MPKNKKKKVAPKKKKEFQMPSENGQEIFSGILEHENGETLKLIAFWCFMNPAGKIKDVPLEIWELLADDIEELIFTDNPDDEVVGILFLAITNALKLTKRFLYHDDTMSMEFLEEVFPRWILLVQWYFALREENNKETKLDDVIFFDTKFLSEMDVKKIEDEISEIYERYPEDENDDIF